MILEFTCLLTTVFIGRPQWVSLEALFAFLKYDFIFETELAFVLSSWIVISIIGLFKMGFLRYLSRISLLILLCLFSLFIFGYLIFTWMYLDGRSDLSGFIDLFAYRYQSQTIWYQFIYVELILFFLFVLGVGFVSFERFKPSSKKLGKAHFSSGFEIFKSGFFKKEEQSILIGKKYGAPLYANGFEHVLVFAPTGSGKTRSIGMPNLFFYPYSVICNDVKLTLFNTTSRYRETVLGHQCYCWAPASEERRTHRYNPLSFISQDKTQRLTDIQRIAHILIPDNKKSDPIWQQASRKLFKVAVLYLLDTPDCLVTLGEINRLVKQAGFDEWLATILEETTHLDPEFYRNGYSYLNNHEKTRSSILETFSGYFELFDDPMIDVATSASDFDLRRLRSEKITIYIGFTDDDMERLSPLLTLFWQQFISIMIKRVPDLVEEPYPVLCLIDEFSSLGRIERLRRSLKLLREYRVRCVLIMQYIAQTYEQYSHDEAKAFTNIKTKIAFATEDLNDAEYVSKLLGTKTVRISGESTSTQAHGYSQSISYQYQAIPLLHPDEVMRLPSSQILIIRTGHSPVKAEQLIWYDEKSMKVLACGSSEVPYHEIIPHPFLRENKFEITLLKVMEN